MHWVDTASAAEWERRCTIDDNALSAGRGEEFSRLNKLAALGDWLDSTSFPWIKLLGVLLLVYLYMHYLR